MIELDEPLSKKVGQRKRNKIENPKQIVKLKAEYDGRPKIKKQIDDLIKVLEYGVDTFDKPIQELLNNHPLHGELDGEWSINITGNLRLIYQPIGSLAGGGQTFKLLRTGGHSEVHKRKGAEDEEPTFTGFGLTAPTISWL